MMQAPFSSATDSATQAHGAGAAIKPHDSSWRCFSDGGFSGLRLGLSYVILGCQIAIKGFVACEAARVPPPGNELCYPFAMLKRLSEDLPDPIEGLRDWGTVRERLQTYPERLMAATTLLESIEESAQRRATIGKAPDVDYGFLASNPSLRHALVQVIRAVEAFIAVGDFVTAIESAKPGSLQSSAQFMGSESSKKMVDELRYLTEFVPAIGPILAACEGCHTVVAND